MTHRKSVFFTIAFRSRASKGIYAQSALKFIPFMVKIMMICWSCKPQNIFAHFENDNLADIMTEAPFMMEQTTAYVALENFKKLEYIMLCFR
jgi:putative hemolysin